MTSLVKPAVRTTAEVKAVAPAASTEVLEKPDAGQQEQPVVELPIEAPMKSPLPDFATYEALRVRHICLSSGKKVKAVDGKFVPACIEEDSILTNLAARGLVKVL